LLNECEPIIFVVIKDGEFWATSSSFDYSTVVLPNAPTQERQP
jgi:hypothetical protein